MFNGNYRGQVKQHGESGLCKVFVPSVMPSEYENKPDELPWCEPAQPMMLSSKNGGMFQYPELNETVWVFFEGGFIGKPVMFATTIGTKFDIKPKKYILKTDTFIMEIDDNESVTNVSINTLNVDAKVNITGDVSIKGNLGVSGDTTTDGITNSGGDVISGGDVVTSLTTVNTHKHIGNKGKPTSPPIP